MSELAGQWRLLEITGFTPAKGNRPHRISFTVLPEGDTFEDPYFTSPKAITRLEAMLSRAGYDEDLLKAHDFSQEHMAGLRVWALLTTHEYQGIEELRTDGWNFRPETDPPEEERTLDYGEPPAPPAAAPAADDSLEDL